MAEALLGEHERFICAICLDLLKDPVTIPCGHSYCMTCIDECWNKDDHSGVYSCPQCRNTFNSRPSLNRSTILAEIMEKLRDTTLQMSSSAQSLAGPEDIACDFCPERKFKAVKSCPECQCSYCEEHLHPHYNVPALKKHRLVKAAVMLSYTCSKHDKLLEVYCRTDNKCVCTHCLMDDHKAHDTVPSAVERKEKQIKLTENLTRIKQMIQAKELQRTTFNVASHSHNAQKSVEDSKRVFTELIHLIEMKSTEVIEKIKAHEKADLEQCAKLEEKLMIEITELQRRHGLLQTLLETEDNIHFLQNFEAVSSSSSCDDFPTVSYKPSYIDVYKYICELKKRLDSTFNEEISKTLKKVSDLDKGNTPLCIKIGDRVRVKPSVQNPKYNWGRHVTHNSVGVVQDIKGDKSLVVKFPGNAYWKGVISEMELVTDDGLPTYGHFHIGDTVCVSSSVTKPRHGWRGVTHNSIGVIKSIQGEDLTVEFPKCKNWNGVLSEMQKLGPGSDN